MSITSDIKEGIVGIILLIVAVVILLIGIFALMAPLPFQIVGIILIVIGGGIVIASRKRIYGG